MPDNPNQPAVNGRWPDLPLPGFYPVLTWQLNATITQSSGMGKFVSIVREPVDQREIYRTHKGLEHWVPFVRELDAHLRDLPAVLGYLMGSEAFPTDQRK